MAEKQEAASAPGHSHGVAFDAAVLREGQLAPPLERDLSLLRLTRPFWSVLDYGHVAQLRVATSLVPVMDLAALRCRSRTPS